MLFPASFMISENSLMYCSNLLQVKEYGTQNVDWLPDKLPENVKIVFSVSDDSPVFAEIQKKVKSLSALIPVSCAHG
jgi:hypothetical protein